MWLNTVKAFFADIVTILNVSLHSVNTITSFTAATEDSVLLQNAAEKEQVCLPY